MTTITSLENVVPDIEYQIDAIVFKIDREGEPEKKRPISIMLQFEESGIKFKAITWEYSLLDTFKEAIEKRSICSIKIKCSIYKDTLNVKITDFSLTDKQSKLPVVKEYDGNEEIDNMKQIVAEKIKYITNPNYITIINQLITNNEAFFTWKAAKSIHHAFVGGLVLHSVSVCENAINLANQYIDKNGFAIDWNLLIAGSLLHDIGKLREYTAAGEFSEEGMFLSHLVSGIEMIDDVCRSNNIDPYTKDIILLKHIIASHHGKLEFGSPNTPMVPEAYIVNYADEIDANMESMTETLNNMNTGDLSPNIRNLDNGRVFKLY